MNKAWTVGGLALLFFTTLTQAQKVDVDYDPGASFARMKTFAWDPDNPLPPTLQDLNANRVEAALRTSVENYLRSRNFFQVMSQADFLVSYTFSANSESEPPSAVGAPSGVEEGWRPFRQENGSELGSGAIVLTVRDSQKKAVVWQARAYGVLVPDKKLDRNIDKAVKKMLSKFPPK